MERNFDISDSTLFATPPTNKSRDIDVQTFIQSPAIIPLPTIDETPDPPTTPLPPYVDLIFSHMNEVNQWINQFCADTQAIQNDIQTIRVSLHSLSLSLPSFSRCIRFHWIKSIELLLKWCLPLIIQFETKLYLCLVLFSSLPGLSK